MHSERCEIIVDVKKYFFNQKGNLMRRVLCFELLNLSREIHHVSMRTTDSGYVFLDAIDIDEDAYLVDLDSPASKMAILRVTMIDSSEREYRLTMNEIESFVHWYNYHVNSDERSFAIDDVVDYGKEYITFDKIISFKVIKM